MNLTLKKMSFKSSIVLWTQNVCPPSPPMSISAISKEREILSFSKGLRYVDEKRAAATPLVAEFAKIVSEDSKNYKSRSLSIIG